MLAVGHARRHRSPEGSALRPSSSSQARVAQWPRACSVSGCRQREPARIRRRYIGRSMQAGAGEEHHPTAGSLSCRDQHHFDFWTARAPRPLAVSSPSPRPRPPPGPPASLPAHPPAAPADDTVFCRLRGQRALRRLPPASSGLVSRCSALPCTTPSPRGSRKSHARRPSTSIPNRPSLPGPARPTACCVVLHFCCPVGSTTLTWNLRNSNIFPHYPSDAASQPCSCLGAHLHQLQPANRVFNRHLFSPSFAHAFDFHSSTHPPARAIRSLLPFPPI